jgi:hypothetical protein
LPDELLKAFNGELPDPFLDNIDSAAELQAAEPEATYNNAADKK